MRTLKRPQPTAHQPAVFRLRRSVQAIQLALCCGAASALPAAASCALDGATVSTVVGFADSCDIAGTLAVTGTGFLTTFGAITNRGLISSAGRIDSRGTLNNLGQLVVESGGQVATATSSNLFGTTLTGGNWRVMAGSGKASLSIGRGTIATNAADITLNGRDASFAQLTGLTLNQSALRIENGNQFSVAQLENTGAVTVASGAAVTIGSSSNFVGKTLTGGTWAVYGDGGPVDTVLKLGVDGIDTNAAYVELSGIGSRFDQLNSLADNQGVLVISKGRQFTLPGLTNTGTVSVKSGGALTLGRSGNLVNGTLTGGTWEIFDATNNLTDSSLVIGTGQISVNNASILLAGSRTSFQQLDNLRTNNGALTITDRRNFTALDFTNNGTLTVGAGSSVTIAKSSNVVGTTLTKGVWRVSGGLGEAGSLRVGTGTITTNNATVLLSGDGAHFDQLTGLTGNQGVLKITAGHHFTAGELVNTGSLAVESLSRMDGMTGANKLQVGFTQLAGSTQVGGVLAMRRINITGGTLSGGGELIATDHITIGSGAVVRPGLFTGALKLDGDVSFSGLLEIDLSSPTAIDLLQVSGVFDFQTGAKVKLLLGFAPVAPAYSFEFLQAGNILGQPTTYELVGDSLGYSQQLQCAGHSCRFDLIAAAVPEPASYALWLAGLGALGFGARWRKQAPRGHTA